jgi:hypothetical protein
MLRAGFIGVAGDDERGESEIERRVAGRAAPNGYIGDHALYALKRLAIDEPTHHPCRRRVDGWLGLAAHTYGAAHGMDRPGATDNRRYENACRRTARVRRVAAIQ